MARPRRSPWRSWVRGAFALAVLGSAAGVAVSHKTDIANALHLLSHLDAYRLAAAIGAELLSMMAFARLQRWLLRTGGVRLGLWSMAEVTLAGNALGTTLPGGVAWGATWSFAQLRRRGAGRALAIWALLAAGALSTFTLFVVIVAGAFVAGPRGPLATLRPLAGGLAAIPVGTALLVAALNRSAPARKAAQQSWKALAGAGRPGRALVAGLGRLWDGVRTVRPNLAEWAKAAFFALANWLFDAGCLVGSAWALHAGVPWRGLLAAYGLTQIAVSLPVTPGGLGVVEASLTALLAAYGMPAATALATTLVYRAVSFWALQPVGWGTWAGLELAGRLGARHRSHPWAVHSHAGGRAVPSGPLEPSPCTHCDEDLGGAHGKKEMAASS
jgi:uncharacterized membrane protein YbhN (UPF0104 family)